MFERIFGHIPDYPVGSWFESRAALSEAGLHRPRVAGISGTEGEGADSIVLSGGYEDDTDWGNEIVYTGHGGRDQATGKQITHQKLSRGNLALAKSRLEGLPVRVIRGSTHKSSYSPPKGYRYDGLYRVEDHWQERGRSGYYIWRYRLIKSAEATIEDSLAVTENKGSYSVPQRQETTILRIVRDTKLTRKIKEIYNYHCQVCEIRLEGAAGPYVEAAHIRPLGMPHNGADCLDNLLCLCPNHHVLFDYGAFAIADDLSLIGIEDSLTLAEGHCLCPANLRYHREHYFLRN
jgi:putative restriction endonuclease